MKDGNAGSLCKAWTPGVDRRTALAWLGGALGSSAAFPSAAGEHGFKLVHAFTGADGSQPNGSLVQTADGRLQGTTHLGGAKGSGEVYSVSMGGAFRLRQSFGKHGAAGYSPRAALSLASDGQLYGSTYYGGSHNAGTLFKLGLDGKLTVLHDFTLGPLDGGFAHTPPLPASDGNLYGCTASGGSHSDGTFYRLTPEGEWTLLRSFRGARPGGLVASVDGYFYGTTAQGGAYDMGSVFRLTRDGGMHTVHDFAADGHEGVRPDAALLEAADGRLYGVTFYGGAIGWGAVFRLRKNGELTVLHNFSGDIEGSGHPSGSLIQAADGHLFGVANGGLSDGGAVYRLSTSGGGFRLLHRFVYGDNAQGFHPAGALLQASDGRLYGTTQEGGGVFRIQPG